MPGRSSRPRSRARREQRHHLDAGLPHKIHVAAAQAIHAGLVGDQADALAGQGAEFLRRQDVQAGARVAVA